MKSLKNYLLACTILFSLIAGAQKKHPVLLFKNEQLKTSNNITEANIESFNKKAARYKNKTLAVLQFESLPSLETRNLLLKQGIELLEYIPENAYTVSITGKLNAGLLQRVKARAIIQLSPKQKMHPALAVKHKQHTAKSSDDFTEVQLSFPRMYSVSDVLQFLGNKNIQVIGTELQQYRVLKVRVATNRLEELSSFPIVEYVEPVIGEDKPLNDDSRNLSRANVLNASAANGGRDLKGEGVVIGIGDAGDIQAHIDIVSSHIINRVSGPQSGHAIRVHGVAAGSGIINDYYTGIAPKATIISQVFSNILWNAGTYVQDHGMVITNNSYGDLGGCGFYGYYNISSRVVDQHAFDYPYLQHVFASGNDGYVSCSPFPAGFHTVFGSYQSAKNVLTVGATNWAGNLWANSSRGPVLDGRTKPELVALGDAISVPALNNLYLTSWGTSFSSPAVAGGLALLYQRYRQLHGGNPKNGLMKALICNGSEDKGNVGPDFSYGYGSMSLNRSLDMLENGRYINANIAHASSNQHIITIPSNTAQLKVMLYWNDPAASLLSSRALVNDLDLKVIDPGAVTHLPKILDTSASGVLNPATTGVDKINNMEQVVVMNPAPGAYTINIDALVAQNPSQEYFIVYDIIPQSTVLTFPLGGEGFVSGGTANLQWDSYGEPANTFTIKYSLDNGNSWTDINTAVDANARMFNWSVPNVATDQALIRIERNGTSISSTSNPFTIIGQPVITLSATQCEGYAAIQWDPIAGATDYEVMLYRNSEMRPFATTTSTSYIYGGLHPDSTYWFSVRARVNGKAGKRSVAISRVPSDGLCAGSISDNDLKLDAITAPVSGRKFTSTELGTLPVSVRIENLDDAPATGFTVKYKLNENSWVSQAVPATIGARGTYNYTFPTNENFSAVGDYVLTAVVVNDQADPVTSNDTLKVLIRHLDNQPITLALPFVDNLETAVDRDYSTDGTIGLFGLDRYDFYTASPFGRLRTFINSGVAFSGQRAIMIDASRNLASPYPAASVVGTFNLKDYDVNLQDIRLDFKGRYSSLFTHPNKKVWVRGNDSAPWVPVYSYSNIGLYAPNVTPSIEIADSLKAQGQNFSSSFQIKWELPITGAISNRSYGIGLIMDDIHLYEAVHDMQMIRIDTPVNLSCGLSNAVPLKVTIRNSSNSDLNNVPVKYSLNNGGWIQESIASVPANTTMEYTFTTALNFASSGIYNLRTLVDYPTDNYRANDTLSVVVHNAPLVNTFPYLENFEQNDGGWYTQGANSSWQYGTPASGFINSAASGTKAWKTGIAGNYNDNELSYLYSPCFDVSSLANPMLSLSLALSIENCGSTLCDAAWVEYTTDNRNWFRLSDTASAGTNWYKRESSDYIWNQQDYTRWHVASMPLPKGAANVRLRFVMYSDEAVNLEGIAIDDIHIYDSVQAIYTGVSPSTILSQQVSGNEWVHFTDGNRLIASIHPNNQDLGTTEVQAFIHSGSVRHFENQYYHDRNITIKPANVNLADSVTVRFYFLDSESEALINATGCASCVKPASAYQLGVPKYSDSDDAKEDGSITNNLVENWSFILPVHVKKIPFQKGYYAEFKVKDFSEFWLSMNSLQPSTPLPVTLLGFTANKEGENDVMTRWTTTSESEILHYEVEVAKGHESLRSGRFTTLTRVSPRGNGTGADQQYAYRDATAGKAGAYYYRLKITEEDGSYSYSPIRGVVFAQPDSWLVYPNPSHSLFNLVYQLHASESMQVSIYDAKGMLIKQFRQSGTGQQQKLMIDLAPYAAGTYLLQTNVNGDKRFFKLYKQ